MIYRICSHTHKHICKGVKGVNNDPRSLNRVSEHVQIKDPSLKYRKNKNISKKQTYVEHGVSARYSRVATLRMCVNSPWSKDLDNHWTDFYDFSREVIRQKDKKSNRARFLKKDSILEIWGIKGPKWVKNGSKMEFFGYFSKMTLTFFFMFCVVLEIETALILAETACFHKFPFQSYTPENV